MLLRRSVGLLAVVALLAGCASDTSRMQDACCPPPLPRAAMGPAANYSGEQYRLINQRDEIVSVLDNGATVIVKRIPSSVVAVRGYCHTGGLYEKQWLGGGLSHLCEHLLAGGTCQRRTELENLKLLQKIGNNSDAQTDFDQTAFYINTTTDHAEEAIDLVTGWMLGAKITEAEFEREREVVQRELEKDAGEPDWAFFHLTSANRYFLSPAAVPVIGYQPVIKKLTREDVWQYYKMAYVPNNLIFSVVGDLPPEQMLAMMRKYLADAPPGRAFDHNIADEPDVLGPRTMAATFPKLGGSRLAVAWPSVKLTNPDMYAMDLLATILGTGKGSMMVEDIVDKRHLVDDLSASDNTPEYARGTFEIDLTLGPRQSIADAKQAVLEMIEKIKTDGIDADRIARAKVQMRNQQVFGRITSEDIASTMAEDFLTTHDPHFTDRYLGRVEAVTPEQLKAVARKYLVPDKLLTTAMLDDDDETSHGLPKAEELLREAAPTTQSSDQPANGQVVRSELPNGTVLLVKRFNTSPAVYIKLYSLGGVSAEDEKTNGLGNMSMEFALRGTDTRSGQSVAEFFDSVGGEMTGSCGNNSWSWEANCLKQDLPKTLEVFADVVNHPSFPKDAMEPIRQEILVGIGSEDSDWLAQAQRYFKTAYFGPLHSPYQFLPIGTADNVAHFDRDQIEHWYKDKVLASKKVLAIYGDVDPDEAKKLATELLGQGEKPAESNQIPVILSESHPATPSADVPAINVLRVETNKTDNTEAGIVIGFDANGYVGEPADYAVDVAGTMAGGWTYPTGYLFELLRGRGLVYDVEAFNVEGRNKSLPGVFMVYAGCEPAKVNEVVSLILQEMSRLQASPADMQPEWFERSKELMITAEAINNETPANQAQQQAIDELMGVGYQFHDHFSDGIKKISIYDVQLVAKARLSRCVITVSTNQPGLVNIAAGAHAFKSLPPVDLTPGGVQHDTASGGK